MSTKTRAQLTADAITRFPDNDSKEITAEDLRSYFIDVIDSFVSKKGDSQISGLLSFSSELSLTDRKNVTFKGYVDDLFDSIDLTPLWNISGNTLSARGKLGSTSGAYGFDILVNNVVKAALSNSGYWVFGGDTPYTSQTTTATFKGTGTTSATNTFVGLNSADALIFKLRDDGGFIFYEDLYDSTPTKILNTTNRLFYTTGSIGAIALNEFALYPNNSFSSLEWDLRIQKDSNNDEVLDWENREFTKDWKFNNVAIMASYTVATLPTVVTGGLIYVSDESGGAVLAFSDGTNWRRVTDRAIVS